MAYCGYITTLTNVRPHSNADRMLLGDCFGNTVCVGLEYTEGMIGVYFSEGGQLSEEFCTKHDLVRRKDENGKACGGYLEPGKRNIKAVRLRGEKSDGLFMPLSALDYCFDGKENSLKVGDTITVVNGHEVCTKYIPRSNHRSYSDGGDKTNTKKKSAPISPLFAEHADTEQLAYNLNAFQVGDEIEVSLKMHGTSQRTGYLPVLKGYKRTLVDRILHREGKPIYDWGYVSGTRRVVLENYDGGFYGSNDFREQHSKIFEGKLRKGEVVYYEVVGFTTGGLPIMGDGNNKKLNDKEFVKMYGDTTTFSYGCEVGESDMYVYRIVMVNEDGDIVEYSPDFMRYRCAQMGVKCVPEFERFILNDTLCEQYGGAGEAVKAIAEEYYDGPDPIGKTHVREGVVVRIVNRPTFTAYKHKNYSFKCLAGIAIAQAEETGAAENMTEDMLAEM